MVHILQVAAITKAHDLQDHISCRFDNAGWWEQ